MVKHLSLVFLAAFVCSIFSVSMQPVSSAEKQNSKTRVELVRRYAKNDVYKTENHTERVLIGVKNDFDLEKQPYDLNKQTFSSDDIISKQNFDIKAINEYHVDDVDKSGCADATCKSKSLNEIVVNGQKFTPPESSYKVMMYPKGKIHQVDQPVDTGINWLPKEPKGVGESWNVVETIKTPQGKMEHKMVYTVKSFVNIEGIKCVELSNSGCIKNYMNETLSSISYMKGTSFFAYEKGYTLKGESVSKSKNIINGKYMFSTDRSISKTEIK